jgi:hypothetical protein
MKIINKLLKIATKENAKTLDETIAYMKELEAELDEEMTERMRLEEHLHIARRFLSGISAEIRLQVVKADKTDWLEMLQELEALQKKLAYGTVEC